MAGFVKLCKNVPIMALDSSSHFINLSYKCYITLRLVLLVPSNTILRIYRHIILDAVHFVLQFKFLSFQEGDVELLSAVAAGKIPPHVRVVIADNPKIVSFPR